MIGARSTVFDFVADERNEPRFNPRMLRAEKVSDGPIGLGTRFRAEMRTMGRTAAMTIELTGYERPRRLASATHLSTMDIEGALTFDAIPEGTRMRWSWEVETPGVLKLFAPIVARMGQRQEQTIWTKLKRLYPALIKGWTDDIYNKSLAAAKLVQAQLVRAEGFPDLGLDSRSDITGFNWSNVPAILPELGFLTNPTEDRELSSPTGEARAALGLCNGIVAFVNSERLHVRNRCSGRREQT